MKNNRLVEDAKLDPSRIYPRPQDVLRDRRLSDVERLEILTSWERGARAMSVPTEMAAAQSTPERLREVIQARMEVEERLPHGTQSDAVGRFGKSGINEKKAS
jgi:hypothetical protein